MKRIMSKAVLVTMVVAAMVVPQPLSASKELSITDLGTLGGTSSEARAINNRGQVGGQSNTASEELLRAVLWQDGVITDLGLDVDSAVLSINERGQAVGVYSPGGDAVAFLWKKGSLTNLGTLGGINSFATAINERGQIVGASFTAPDDFFRHAFLWQHGVMTDLGLGGRHSVAYDMNNRGHIVGEIETTINTTLSDL